MYKIILSFLAREDNFRTSVIHTMTGSAVSSTAVDVVTNCEFYAPPSSNSDSTSGPASFTSDVEGCDGYLVLTFTKPNKAGVKQNALENAKGKNA